MEKIYVAIIVPALRTTTAGTVSSAQLGGAFGSLALVIKTAGADESN